MSVDQFVAIFDALSNQGREDRSRYHVTLAELISVLESTIPHLHVRTDTGYTPSCPHSYRGYYSDLALEPSPTPTTVGEFLPVIRGALNSTFTGYKGGDFLMNARTPLWIARYGNTGVAVVGYSVTEDSLTLITKNVD